MNTVFNLYFLPLPPKKGVLLMFCMSYGTNMKIFLGHQIKNNIFCSFNRNTPSVKFNAS